MTQKPKDCRLTDHNLFLGQAPLKLGKAAIGLFLNQLADQLLMWFQCEALVAAELFRADATRLALTPDEPPNRTQTSG